jgi:outer membrane protein assembly factor BamC
MRHAVVLLLLASLSGCSWLTGEDGYFRDRSDDYRKARVEPRLQVPAGLDSEALQDVYVIPPIAEDLRVTGTFEVPRPVPLIARESEEMVRIQRLGDEEWMLVAVAPGQLWPQVRAFLTNNNLQVARIEARQGLIETAWLQTTATPMDERFRFRLEQGVQRNTSELHVMQQSQVGDISTWPEVSSDPARASEVLMAVAQYIASSTETAPVSMMAEKEIRASGKVSMLEDADGMPWIRLELAYYRAWASVERALRESDFSIRDLDRSSGKYYIRYVPPEDQGGGWFDWLVGDDQEEEARAMTDQDFVLTLAEIDSGTMRISIAREDGTAMGIATAQNLLTLIKGNIN